METSKHRKYSSKEKALLLEAYKSSGIVRKQWCQENGIGLSTLQRWLQQEKSQANPHPVQNWVPVVETTPKKSDTLEIQIGKCTISVTNKTDKKLLAAVLDVMVEVC